MWVLVFIETCTYGLTAHHSAPLLSAYRPRPTCLCTPLIIVGKPLANKSLKDSPVGRGLRHTDNSGRDTSFIKVFTVPFKDT